MDIFNRARQAKLLILGVAALTMPLAAIFASVGCSGASAANEDDASMRETQSADAGKPEGKQSASADGLDWQNDFDKALEQGKVEKKFVLVDVYTDWCGYCKKLDKEVYANPAISKYLAEKFIVVRANAEDNAQGQAFADKFDTHAFPTILVFDYKGAKTKPKAKILGYLPPTEFDTAMHSIVESKKFKQKHTKSN